MLCNGWVAIPRDILEYEWADDCNTMWCYIVMLIRANIKETEWHGITVWRGSFVSSFDSLSKETGLTVQKLRTVIKRLESTGKITRSKYSKFTVFTLVDYEKMQKPTIKSTIGQQADNTQITGNQHKNNKNNKKDKNNKNEYMGAEPAPAKKFARPSIEEIKAYCNERKNNISAEHFFDYYESNGWMVGKNPMRNWKAAVRTWEKNSYSQRADAPQDFEYRELADGENPF